MTVADVRPQSEIVTLVFTDIEGSTRLLHELGDDYLAVLEEHNRRVRGAMTSHGGTEVKNEGDGFLFVFDDPYEAVIACGDTQRALAQEGWPHGRPVRVRVGAHLGPVVMMGGDYVGLAVHEAARVCNAASGGQVVMTDALLQAVGGELPSDLSLVDLGEYRLRDFPEARRLHQATIGEPSRHFPPLRPVVAHRTVSVPAPPTTLVGRKTELAEIERTLLDDARLVTITGPGGIGKTRLALEAAWGVQAHFPRGVWFIDLTSVTDHDAILPTIQRAVGAKESDGFAGLRKVFGEMLVLLVLDNLEQVVRGAGHIADALSACPTLTILATSRERLRVRAEHEIVLGGLSVGDSVALLERVAPPHARDKIANDRPAIETICTQLDGIPLALELVASQLRHRTPADVLDALRESLGDLADDSRDRPERQRAMRAAIDWSWDLLDTDERRTLTALAVTSGTATEELAASLARAAGVSRDVVPSLVDKSLLVRADGKIRLLETIRQFAAEQVDDRPALEQELVRWCAELVALAAPHISGPDAPRWLDRLDDERNNIRTALESDPNELLLAQLTDIVEWWTTRGHWTESRSVLRGLLARPLDDVTRATIAAHCAAVTTRQGYPDEAEKLAEQALEIARRTDSAPLLARARNILAEVDRLRGGTDHAEMLYLEALSAAGQAGDVSLVATITSNLGVLMWQNGRFTDARRWWTDALVLAESQDDLRGVAILQSDLGLLDIGEGNLDRGESRLVTALATGQRLDDPLVVGQGLLNLGVLAKARGDEPLARARYTAALEVYERIGDAPYIAAALLHLAIATDSLPNARAWAERALDVANECGDAVRTAEARQVLTVLDEIEAEQK